MNDFNQTYPNAGGATRPMDMSVDAGLRAFMLGVYNKMALGLFVSAVLAYVVGTVTPVTQVVLSAPMIYVVQWGPVALLLGSSFLMRNPSPTSSAVLYWSIVSLIGAGLGVWVFLAVNSVGAETVGGRQLAPTITTIAQAFFITATAFLGLSLWGYTTKRDLSGIGSFIFMAILGVLALSIVNIFVGSGMLENIIMGAALLLFSGLIAWQTQSLKASYYALQGDGRGLAVMTNIAALNLYIAFVQIFQIVLSLLSSRN